MDAGRLIRWSGMVLMLGGIVVAVGFGIHPYGLYPSNSLSQDVASPLWVPSHLTLYFGEMLIIFGLMGLFARVVRSAGRLAWVGFVLTTVGGITFAGSTLFSDVVASLFLQSQSPALVDNYPSYLTSSAIGQLAATVGFLLFIGYVLFSVSIVRTRVFPGWTTWLIGLWLVGIAFFIIGVSYRIVYSLGGIFLGLSLSGWGYALWNEIGI